MRSVRADFSRRSPPSPWLWGLLALLALAALAAGGWAWREWQGAAAQRAALRDAAVKPLPPIAMPAPRAPAPYDTSAREMLAERRFPWPKVLTAIEATAVVGVTPTAVEFAAGDKSARVEVSFVDFAKLLDYVDQLNAGEAELRWTLIQSQAQAAGGGTATVAARLITR
ncbi:MAG TPA: hypothetical protein VF169_10675 [Albitalea sp.]|uniref:hypothetical protein n=1 Tax=Piscinibacter sp. TaxID=1903157 RepID=UPI002ED5F920